MTRTLGYGFRVAGCGWVSWARRTGTTVRALRYYEAAGLVVPRRLSNGYREYDPIAERQVGQIRELMALGLAIEETRPFVESIANGDDVGAAAVATFRSTVSRLQQRIGELTAQRDTLDARIDDAARQVVTGRPGVDLLTRAAGDLTLYERLSLVVTVDVARLPPDHRPGLTCPGGHPLAQPAAKAHLISSIATGRCSARERVQASAIQPASTASATVHGLSRRPAAIAVKATSSRR